MGFILAMAMVMAMLIIAIVYLWWYGFFLPGWIDWQEKCEGYGGGQIVLEKRTVTFYEEEQPLFRTEKDWFVQDMLLKDVDLDGSQEMILLVWKHGSYGKRMPFWVKKNDKRLRQHIFIYKYDGSRYDRMKPVWMSSEIRYEIESISSGKGELLDVKDRSGTVKSWIWRDFGLKLVGEKKAKE